MSLTIRDEVTPALNALLRRLTNLRPVLEAGARVIREVDHQTRMNAAVSWRHWPLPSNPAFAALHKQRAQQWERMRKDNRVVWPFQRPTMPVQITPLTAYDVTVMIAPESRSAVNAAKPQIECAMQAKLDDIVRGR